MNLRKLRTKLGMTQTEFWKRVSCTQSAGSRFERGNRRISKPVQRLIGAVYLGKPILPYRRTN